MPTPETLPRHELIGLPVRVVESSDPTLVGLEGEVVMETTNTLHVETDANANADEAPTGASGRRAKQVPKAAATFEFALPDGHHVTVEGERLVARPARRTERRSDSTWR